MPLSIIIVGVGNACFDAMNELCADEGQPLYSRSFNKFMEQDIVQFVPFNEFKHDSQALAREVLGELPKQFLHFMGRKGIVP